MPAAPDTRLYLFAMLPDEVGDHLAVSNDIEPALPGLKLVSAARRHITLANLSAIDAPEDYRIRLAQWVMATMPPFAFHVVFDQLVGSARNTLLKASRPLVGALEARRTCSTCCATTASICRPGPLRRRMSRSATAIARGAACSRSTGSAGWSTSWCWSGAGMAGPGTRNSAAGDCRCGQGKRLRSISIRSPELVEGRLHAPRLGRAL